MGAPDLTSVFGIRDAVRDGEISARDVCERTLSTIRAGDAGLNAFNLVMGESALDRASALDRSKEPLPLKGVPIAVKDNICTRGHATTASSRILSGYVPPYDATVIARLQAAGAIVIGKTNCDEFAMGSSTENSANGPSRNPWNTDYTPGGSSGGSAVAVAAGLVPAALGSDTGGSIRQPASFCGLVGVKPSYGRVSRYGLLAFASSLDQIGPFTRTVREAAAVLAAIAGADPADSTAAPDEVPDFEGAAIGGSINGLRVGVPRSLLESGVEEEVLASLHAALDTLLELGATLVDVELPYASAAIPVYYLVATAEASSNLARYDGVRYGFRAEWPQSLNEMYRRTRDQGFGPEVKRRIMLGTYVLSAGYYDAYYLKAQQVRTLIASDYTRAFERVDVVAMPTSPTPPFRLGERVADPLQMYLADVFTVSANLSGLPAISVPCGFTRDGLPIGLQLTSRMFDEVTMLRAADAYERATEWTSCRPPTHAAAQ
jgi:aspartyl-tRNA(Asn)/glutamyl-tRNA(Gln) amidotransferase subunit A